MTWPSIPYPAWRETAEALHLWLQVIGKYRLARTPWLNHSWHATFYVTARGLTTSAIPEGVGAVDVEVDLLAHRVLARSSDGRLSGFDLEPMSVADFYDRARAAIAAVGGSPRIDIHPNEVMDPIPFPADRERRAYDRDSVNRFFDALAAADAVLKRFRTGFLGKSSPVHLFWGSFDLAVTRFSGRAAPPHPGGIPALPDAVTREAYSHEVSSAGFWPGDGRFEAPAFYSYAYPAPEGFASAALRPNGAFYDENLGEFLLPYEEVRTRTDPEAAVLEFLQSSYEAAADLGGWDRAALECAFGEAGVPREITPGRIDPAEGE